MPEPDRDEFPCSCDTTSPPRCARHGPTANSPNPWEAHASARERCAFTDGLWLGGTLGVLALGAFELVVVALVHFPTLGR
jgi:hypothetical protein